MCGITGEIRRAGDGNGHVSRQLDCLRHRGPDATGVFDRAEAWVGQTRLSIIDVPNGDPPVMNEDATLGVALNGEIYNYRELRSSLRQRGHTLATEGDTEVIAHLAEELEPASLASALEGMFALAVWDVRRHRLILARDRFGKKPLYYWHRHGRLVFGSEIKSILANPHVPRDLRAEAIPGYLAFGYVPSPHTFFEGIRSVPPGHVLTARAGEEPVLERYWEPRFPGSSDVERVDGSFEHSAREVRRLLTAAVERRLMSDVPLGAFLSGGIDSSAVVALMAQATAQPVPTFTIGFEDSDGFDERPYARTVAERYRTDHTEFVVEPHATELIERLVWHYDQPFGDSSSLPTFLLSELTGRHVTVALCGDGGDELFGGYERIAAALGLARYEHVPGPVRSGVRRVAEGLRPHVGNGRLAKLTRLLVRSDLSPPLGLMSWVSYVPRERRVELLGSDAGADAARDRYEQIWDRSQGAHPLDRVLDLNLRSYLLDDLLPKVDRMSMAHGLEVRSPYLDRELAEFSFRLPAAARVRGLALKRVLRAAVGDLLPEEILQRPKRGFGVPLDRWFRSDLSSYLDGMLCAPDTRIAQHLSRSAVLEMVRAHQAGSVNCGQELWTLLTLEIFLRREGW